ncbi:MAG TPA: DUF192 domain-containing protein [Myxococcales bacterium]|jgi:uncharacterized membrane protein (UPF0127 family)|nr:DUF192 domain-containing protein [Myxococcales bacterium]
MRRLLIGLLCIAACHGEAAEKAVAPPAATGSVRFDTPRGPWVVKVEIANDDATRTRGLMFRRSLEPDHGMIFVFPASADHNFWMHNTLISLDLIFLDDTRAVLGVVANAAPQTDTLRGVGKPSRYVIEVAGGEAAVHAVAAGTRAAFVDVPE